MKEAWRLKHSILWSHMSLLLATSSKPANQTVSTSCESNLIHVTRSPLCYFGMQPGNFSKNYFEKERKKKKELVSQQQCNRGRERKTLIQDHLFWLIHTIIKKNYGQDPRGQSMFWVFQRKLALIKLARSAHEAGSKEGKWTWTLMSVLQLASRWQVQC